MPQNPRSPDEVDDSSSGVPDDVLFAQEETNSKEPDSGFEEYQTADFKEAAPQAREKKNPFRGRRRDKDPEPQTIEELSKEAPAVQVARRCIVRGFDPGTGIATFVYQTDKGMLDFSARISQTSALRSGNAAILMDHLGKDRAVPAVSVRLALSPDPDVLPEIIRVQPIELGRRQQFKWMDSIAVWSDPLDEGVEVHGEWISQEFANGFLLDLLSGDEGNPLVKESLDKITEEAKAIFESSAKEIKLDVSVNDAFKKELRGLAAIINYSEGLTDEGQSSRVRYDSRYSFSQQCGHAKGDYSATIRALVGYSYQRAVCQYGASRAVSIDCGNGEVASLLAKAQQDLIDEKVLLYPSPKLNEEKESFKVYSFELARLSLARALAGALDSIGAKAARPEIDLIEQEKKYSGVEDSLHLIAINEMPPPADNEREIDGAGRYIATLRNITAGGVAKSKAHVATMQTLAAPRMPRNQGVAGPNMLAETIVGGIRTTEQTLEIF